MKILLIGPIPMPLTGVSLANQIIIDYFHKYTQKNIMQIDTNYTVLKEDIGQFNFSKVFHYVKQYKDIFKIKTADKVYVTPGQTFFGVLKYFPYILVAKILNKELIVHIHGNYLATEYNSLQGLKKKIFKSILSMTDKGIVLSSSLKRNILPFVEESNIFILENFVEDILFDETIIKDFSSLKLIYLSNLMEEKGIFDFLEACVLLKEKNIFFQAKIAGGIDEINISKIKAYLLKLKPEVEYMGLVYGKDKKNFLEWGNIFIFPTYYSMEGQPISIFEAMATRNIILTTAHAGIPDVFNEGKNGFYIHPKSPNSIVEKLLILNGNLEQYKDISNNNMLEAKEKYTVQTFIEKLNDIFEA